MKPFVMKPNDILKFISHGTPVKVVPEHKGTPIKGYLYAWSIVSGEILSYIVIVPPHNAQGYEDYTAEIKLRSDIISTLPPFIRTRLIYGYTFSTVREIEIISEKELIEDEAIYIEEYKVCFNTDGSINVGCIKVAKEEIGKILEAMERV